MMQKCHVRAGLRRVCIASKGLQDGPLCPWDSVEVTEGMLGAPGPWVGRGLPFFPMWIGASSAPHSLLGVGVIEGRGACPPYWR